MVAAKDTVTGLGHVMEMDITKIDKTEVAARTKNNGCKLVHQFQQKTKDTVAKFG